NVSASIHALRGLSRASAGRWDEAREAFLYASSRDPANPRFLLMVAVTLLTMGDRESGARALDRCVALAPELAAYREKVLRTFAGGGHADVALIQLHHIMIFSPDLRDLSRDWQE